jgi:membrane-associated phospholipid phosphatase
MNALLSAITDLGDSAVVTMVALVTAAQLAWWGHRRAAVILMFALFAAAGAIGLLKVVFIGCGVEIFDLQIHSPSGHVALSTGVYGVIGAILGSSLTGWRRAIPLVLTILLIGAIAATRIVLGAHTIDEVMIGLAVGGAVALATSGLLRPAPPTVRPIRVGRLLALVVLTLGLMDGITLPAEELVYYLASFLHQNAAFCAQANALPPQLPETVDWTSHWPLGSNELSRRFLSA